MTCDQAELRMAELLLGELPAGERARLERHLLDCASCRAEDELARAGTRIEWADVPVPPALIQSTLASLRETPRAARFFRWAAAAAALVGVAVLLLSSLPGPRPNPAVARGSEPFSWAPEHSAAAPAQTASCAVDPLAIQSAGQPPVVGEREAREELAQFRRRSGEPSVLQEGLLDLKIMMTCDGGAEVDMDVLEPDGTRINHWNRASKLGGVCTKEGRQGPETYTLLHAAPGTYRVGAHLERGGKSVVKFVTFLYEGTPKEERREETLLLEKGAESPRFIREIVIP